LNIKEEEIEMGNEDSIVNVCGPGMHNCNGNCVAYECWAEFQSFYQLQTALDELDTAVKNWCNVGGNPTETVSRVNQVRDQFAQVIELTRSGQSQPPTYARGKSQSRGK
jgi:ribosomal protein S16